MKPSMAELLSPTYQKKLKLDLEEEKMMQTVSDIRKRMQKVIENSKKAIRKVS